MTMQALDVRQPADVCDVSSATVIKIGGSTLDKAQQVFRQVVHLWRTGRRPVVVHGGGPAINRWLHRLGVEPHFSGGRRVTDAATLEVVRAVMVGQINGDIVRTLAAAGGRAVGFSGIDGGLIHARRAAPELGLVGQVAEIDPAIIQMAVEAGYIPVITPLGVGPDNEYLNINADDVALAVATALRARDLVFLSDVAGILDRQGHSIDRITPAQARNLVANGVVTGGMVPKVEACLAALASVRRVTIVDGAAPECLLRALDLDGGGIPGTYIIGDDADA
jgi:acetylglutamate kinase